MIFGIDPPYVVVIDGEVANVESVKIMYPHVREHESDDGCYGCCDDCNYDTHRCPMCGTPLAHKKITCSDCEKELNEQTSGI